MNGLKLSIIIPAYNEEHRLRPTLDAYTQYFDQHLRGEYEILLVVNGSTDSTPDMARELEVVSSSLKTVIEPKAIGKGGAIMLGLAMAGGEYIGYVDADGATQPEAFMDLYQNIGDAGLILASRWLPGAIVEPKQPLSRRISSRVFNLIVRTLFKVKITDTQCGAKLMSHQAAKDVLPLLGITRWAFDVDLLFQTRRCGYSMVEHPTVWRDVSGSRLNIPKASYEMLLAICRLRLIYSPFKFIVRAYDITVGPIIHGGKR